MPLLLLLFQRRVPCSSFGPLRSRGTELKLVRQSPLRIQARRGFTVLTPSARSAAATAEASAARSASRHKGSRFRWWLRRVALPGFGLVAAIAASNGALMAYRDYSVPPPASAVAASAGEGSLMDRPDRAAAVLTKRRLLMRALWLLWSFSMVILMAPLAILSPNYCEARYYRQIYEAIVYSRSAALAKWAQWASIRLDLLPATLCDLLAQLQSQAPIHSAKHTLKELEAAGLEVHGLGGAAWSTETTSKGSKPPAGVLTELDAGPFASGSIAQVHHARWCGKPVILKVRHPRVDEELLLDFELLLQAANLVHTYIPPLRWLNAPATVSQFEAAMSGQTDLSEEGRHLERFSYNFRRKNAWMTFPKVYFATESVLIESFEPGELASEVVKRGQELPRSEAHFIIVRGEDVYLQMLLVDNFMHADLHPGNMLFRLIGPFDMPQLSLIDGGMSARLTDDERRNFIGLLQALGDGDGLRVADRVLAFSKRPAQGGRDTEGFINDVCTMCAQQARGYFTNMDIGVVLRDMMQLMYRHGVAIDGNYATLIANLLCLEGLARQLEPRFNLFDIAYPLLRGHQVLGDEYFRQGYIFAQWIVPLPMWEMFHMLSLYSAMNGEKLKKFQL
mmetsp:Transcript_23101/g.50759  ORF Transcript_23101/g.50759 Transcript_23101/m.50759 type:complete len:621 (-) Transcript_23101:188-2050(-)